MATPKSKKANDKGETFATRYEANLAFFKLSDDEREGLRVAEDAEAGTYSIEPKGK